MSLQVLVRSRAQPPASVDDDFAAAYRSLFVPAMRLAFRITGSHHAAEDIAAEALARAYARWHAVSALEHREAWVMRVTSNLALDAVRRRRPAQEAQRALERAQDCDYRTDDLVATRLALVAALRQLPARQRDSIVLHYLGGLSESEVSASMGITASSVRTHVQRGLRRLREHLSADPEEVLRG